MVVAVEILYLAAVLSGFVGLIGLFALASQAGRSSIRARQSLAGVIVAATVVSVGSYVLYALAPHQEARRAEYGALAAPKATLAANTL